ncbi:hypothetical protein [Patulibacter minatonensis]|uniref:hypothetical protein n=1 Tax=Patulibacter minatonensis TaxID=298163 RepID=UPI00047C233E|nr:hypothetical protein [Patulibacter minatonensis]
MPRLRAFALAGLLSTTLGLAACGGGDDSSETATATTASAGTATTTSTTTTSAAGTRSVPAPERDATAALADQLAPTTPTGPSTPDLSRLADQTAAASRKLGPAAGAALRRDVAASQKQAAALQQQVVATVRDVQAKKLSAAEGSARIKALALRTQETALRIVDRLDAAGVIPDAAKAQIEAARRKIEKDRAAQAK